MFVYKDFAEMLADNYAWNIWHDEGVYSIRYMDDEQLAEAILEDILQVTFYLKKAEEVDFTYLTLVRFISNPNDLKRLKAIFDSTAVMEFVTTSDTGQIRIIDDRHTQQMVMDKIGAWMEGFEPPQGVEVLRVNTEVLEEKIEEHGSIDNLAASLAMEINATNEGNKTLN